MCKSASQFLSVIVCLLLIAGCSSVRTIEQSASAPPAWIHGIETNYLIGYAKSGTYDEAKEHALHMIKEKIARAVAESVSFESELTVQEDRFQNAFEFIEQYSSKMSSKTGGLNYLKGISLSKVTSYYWIRKKHKRKNYIEYYIKYPLAPQELNKLVELWKSEDARMTRKLLALQKRNGNHLAVEDLMADLEEVKALEGYFVDQRKTEAQVVKQQLTQQLKSIHWTPVADSLGFFSYNLMLGNRYLSSYQTPKFISNCAQLERMHMDGNYGAVEYNYDNCRVEEENYFQLTYLFDSIELSRKEPVDVSGKKIFARLKGEISIRAGRGNIFTNTKNIRCHLPVESLSSLPFKIDRIELFVHRCKRNRTRHLPAIIVRKPNLSYCGKGIHQVEFSASIPFWGKRKYSSNTKCLSTVSGKIHYSSEQTGEKKVTQFTGIPYFTTW